jgi:hypothetical protein
MADRRVRILRGLLFVVAVAIIVAGWFTTAPEKARTQVWVPLYLVALVLGLVAVVLAQSARRRSDS